MTNQEQIKNILSRRLKHLGLDRAATAARVCAAAQKVSSDKFEAVSFKNGTLKLRVESIAAAHMIRLRQKTIMAKINSELGGDLIRIIRFEIA